MVTPPYACFMTRSQIAKIDMGRPHGNILGQWIDLVSVTETHGDALWDSIEDAPDSLWTYMPYGPFASKFAFLEWVSSKPASADPKFYAYIRKSDQKPLGMGAFMRMDYPNRVIEIGNIWFAPELQRSREATEAIYLMLQHGFEDLKVRRLEWKCDSLNEPSRRAAKRFGFQFEGVFRQHMIIKGLNRDTAWFAITDQQWPAIKRGFEAWLDPKNFDQIGQAKAKLQTQ